MIKYVIGIDLGINGGLCLMDMEGSIVEMMAMPRHPVDKEIDHYEVEAFFARCTGRAGGHKHVEVYMEKIHGILGNGMKSVNTFGERNGYIKGMVHVYVKRAYNEVSPITWQKWLYNNAKTDIVKKPNGKRDTKKSVEKALVELYPNEDFRKNQRCKVNHDGIMDAVGIARYGVNNVRT